MIPWYATALQILILAADAAMFAVCLYDTRPIVRPVAQGELEPVNRRLMEMAKHQHA